MRTVLFLLAALFGTVILSPEIRATGAAPGHLESVSLLAAGAGSSLALRTSTLVPLVATTAADARTVVIELVGIVAGRRDMAVAGDRMISRLAIDTVALTGSAMVTRVQVSIARQHRHRVRISGNLVYVDFEPADAINVGRAARRQPIPPTRPTAPVARFPVGPTPLPENTILGASRSPAEVNFLERWRAIAETLQHTLAGPSVETVVRRAWTPLVLKDRAIIFSHGDYADLNDRLALLLPFDDNDAPRVEAVSLHKSAIDLEGTARAAESARAARYTLARGPREFADLNQDVSALLNAVPWQVDPDARVKLVETVRQRLIEWPAAHHGYRARDVSDAVSILDPILTQLRAAAGVRNVDLSRAAFAPAPAIVFREPTLIDLIESAMRCASVLTVPTERTAVLRRTLESLERYRADLPTVWFAAAKRRVAAALKSETQADEAYRKLSAGLILRAERAAREGNVRAIAALQSELMRRDQRLGGQRQDVVISTMATLQAQFEVAAMEQLLRDRRAIGAEGVK